MQAEPQAAELQAVTVTGPCSAAVLGSTLPFEHVVAWSMQSRHRPPSDVEEAALRDAPITLQTLSAVREKPLVNLANRVGLRSYVREPPPCVPQRPTGWYNSVHAHSWTILRLGVRY